MRACGTIALIACLAGSAAVAGGARAQEAASPRPTTLTETLAGLARRTQGYYDRLSSIICEETVTQQELRYNLKPVGKPRVTVYELSVQREQRKKGDGEFKVSRTTLFVNGKRAGKYDEPECTDPKTGTPDPLGFLLEKNQRGYKFSFLDAKSDGPEGSTTLAFVQSPPDPVQISWKGSCFNAEGGGVQGRVWLDPDTLDVRQVEAKLAKRFMVPTPSYFAPAVVVERSETTMRFSLVKFENPDETVLLPESMETVTVFSGAPSMRTTQRLSNFRRFLSETVIR